MKAILKKNGIDEVAYFFRRELDKLTRTKGFGQYQKPKDDDKSTEFNDGSLDFLENLVPELKQQAPLLTRFLALIGRPAHYGPNKPLEEPRPAQVMWVSMILYSMRRKKCNNIPQLVGLYCVNSGVKKRIVDILSSIGLCVSYTTVQETLKSLTAVGQRRLLAFATDPTINIAHDNFEFTENPSGERLGQRKTFVSLTNGVVFQGRYLPSEGLHQNSWRPDIPLSATLIIKNIYKDNSLDQVNLTSIIKVALLRPNLYRPDTATPLTPFSRYYPITMKAVSTAGWLKVSYGRKSNVSNLLH